MKTLTVVRKETHFHSDVLPDIVTCNPRLAPILAWADAHPTVWHIVTHTKSKAFGLGSCEYIGWAQRSLAPEAIIERVRHVHELIECPSPYLADGSIFTWRAVFTLEHYKEKGFTGGFFQQHDVRYPRSCLTLDYTPATLEVVLDKFCNWIDRYYETVCVTVNKRTVRTFNGKEA